MIGQEREAEMERQQREVHRDRTAELRGWLKASEEDTKHLNSAEFEEEYGIPDFRGML